MIKIFICFEAVLYLAFTAMDIYALGDSKWFKFAGIALCFVFSVFLSLKGGEKLVTAAIGFAMAADVFLLLLDRYYIAGVGLFFVVQILYFVRIYRANGRKGAWPVKLFLFMGAVVLLINWGCEFPLLLFVAAYAAFFICNVMQASGSENKLFFAGLCVFVLRYLRGPSQYFSGAARVAAPRGGYRNVDVLPALAGNAGAFGKGARRI